MSCRRSPTMLTPEAAASCKTALKAFTVWHCALRFGSLLSSISPNPFSLRGPFPWLRDPLFTDVQPAGVSVAVWPMCCPPFCLSGRCPERQTSDGACGQFLRGCGSLSFLAPPSSWDPSPGKGEKPRQHRNGRIPTQ